MNELNFASLRASKKLVDNGIVLETEAGWYKIFRPGCHAFVMVLSMRSGNEKFYGDNYPAPSMAEVWRELPEEYDTETRHLELQVDKIKRVDGVIVTSANYIYDDTENGCCVYKFFAKENPTDALIDLLVWLKGAGV
jgi:hypothetical protein